MISQFLMLLQLLIKALAMTWLLLFLNTWKVHIGAPSQHFISIAVLYVCMCV